MNNPELGGFGVIDWLVLVGYFILLAFTAVLFSRRQRNTDDYFRAGGSIPFFAASISFLATALSAATFIGGPQQAFVSDLTYLSANIGSIIGIIIVAFYFVPAYYRNRSVTVYSMLENRFGSRSSQAASGTFLAGRIFASGARLYIAAIPASWIVFGDITIPRLLISIGVLVVVGTTYTLAGGIRSVIWTDVIQAVILVGTALVAALVLLHKIPLSFSEIIDALQNPGDGQPSKLAVFKLGLEGLDAKYTVLTAIFGFTLLNIGSYGTDQDMAQRMLVCKDARSGTKSALTAILIGLPVTTLFMGIGLLLYIFYSRPELMGSAAPAYQISGTRQVFLEFLLHEIPPGMVGLMMAGLFAAALSSINSALNAMSSVMVTDFYRKFRPKHSEKKYLQAGRLGVVICGIVIGGFAVISVYWQSARPEATLIDFALQVMVFAYSGLTAVFLCAVFTRRGNDTSVIGALITGFLIAMALQYSAKSSLAFAWQMLIATSYAFGVCCLGKKPEDKP